MNRNLKLGVIEVLNVLPVYYGILNKLVPTSCDIVKGKVTELNHAIAEGRIDISVISSFEYARNPSLYYVFPHLSVGADGPVRSIYLFLKKPIDALDNDTIVLTEFSLTSVHLIRYILQDYNVIFTQNRAIDDTGEVLIADDAIRRYYEGRDPYIYDLSELWKAKTGLPFVFALWVCRRDVFKANPSEVWSVFDALIASKNRSRQLYRQMAEEGFHGIFPDADSCEEYLRNIHYELSDAYLEGFHLFQSKLKDLGKLEQVAPISFLPAD